jgi:hypothetical protein
VIATSGSHCSQALRLIPTRDEPVDGVTGTVGDNKSEFLLACFQNNKHSWQRFSERSAIVIVWTLAGDFLSPAINRATIERNVCSSRLLKLGLGEKRIFV